MAITCMEREIPIQSEIHRAHQMQQQQQEWQESNRASKPQKHVELKQKKKNSTHIHCTLNFIYFYYLLHYIKRAMNPIWLNVVPLNSCGEWTVSHECERAHTHMHMCSYTRRYYECANAHTIMLSVGAIEPWIAKRSKRAREYDHWLCAVRFMRNWDRARALVKAKVRKCTNAREYKAADFCSRFFSGWWCRVHS